MIIAKIVDLLRCQLQSIITLASISQLVLSSKIEEEDNGTNDSHPEKSKTNSETQRITWSLSWKVDIAGNDATCSC